MRRLSPLQDALLFTVAVLIIAVIILITVLFPPPARSVAPYVYTPVPSIAFTPIPEPVRSRIAPEPASPSPQPVVPTRPTPGPAGTGRAPVAGSALSGIATWYAWRPGQAAAGPALRAALGPGWRGRSVLVTAGARSVRVVLTDWCACPGGRVIDLDSRSFAVLAPLSVGVLRVEVR